MSERATLIRPKGVCLQPRDGSFGCGHRKYDDGRCYFPSAKEGGYTGCELYRYCGYCEKEVKKDEDEDVFD